MEPKIKALSKAADNVKLGKEVLEDIHVFQWIVSKKSYDIDYQALEDKYLKGNNFNEKEKTALLDFFLLLSDSGVQVQRSKIGLNMQILTILVTT